jgi:hypothetical protein
MILGFEKIEGKEVEISLGQTLSVLVMEVI